MSAVTVDPRLRERRHAVSAAEQQRRLRRLVALAVVVGLVLLAWGADSRGAQALLTFLRTPESRRLIEAHGYRTERPAD